ncbi:13713_t:CDS:1, partial [Funneliformis mosseae]
SISYCTGKLSNARRAVYDPYSSIRWSTSTTISNITTEIATFTSIAM